MKKIYYVFADWRKKDVDFINNLNISNSIDIGADSFSIEEGSDYEIFLNHYTKENSLFNKVKPKDFRIQHANSIFTKEELDNAKYYAISSIPLEDAPSSRFPQPNKKYEYIKQVFEGELYKLSVYDYMTHKKQKAPFKIKKPKWKKKEVCFNLGMEYEYTCFKTEFYQEVLAPLGLKSMEVIDYKTNKPLKDTVQLVVPDAKSKLLLENSAYDTHLIEETENTKQYALETLDFFPPFEKEFDFHVCYSLENFCIGRKKIIISKEFCDLLVKHKIIEYNTWNLTPLKNK